MIGIVDVYSHKNEVLQQSYQNNAGSQRDLREVFRRKQRESLKIGEFV